MEKTIYKCPHCERGCLTDIPTIQCAYGGLGTDYRPSSRIITFELNPIEHIEHLKTEIKVL